MQLPPELRARIEDLTSGIPFSALKAAASSLSLDYRAQGGGHGASRKLPETSRLAAYLAVRMPATYAAARAVFEEVRARLGEGAAPGSLLDIGAGTGAASLAALAVFPELISILAIEPDDTFARAGRDFLPRATWDHRPVERRGPLPVAALTVASYCLGELGAEEALDAARRAWEAATVAFVMIEPGTPRGFELVRQVRDQLLETGAHMIAPCPGSGPCPVADGDWCHFAERVERSSLHRRLKDGELGYEDEKFSYVALAKRPATPAEGRVVRRPRYEHGLVHLEVCRGTDVSALRVRKSEGARYRQARRSYWGAAWP